MPDSIFIFHRAYNKVETLEQAWGRSLAMAKNGSSRWPCAQRDFLARDFLCYFLFPVEKKVNKRQDKQP